MSKIFRQEIKFIAGAAKASQLPKLFMPQVLFVGKSNVGKSSLINALCRRKALARVSHTPGRTRQINFFSVAEKFLLADLPGYGFAKVSGAERNNWQELIIHYLSNSDMIKLVNILIDSRRGIKEHDIEVINIVSQLGHKILIVFTKADKMKASEKEILSQKPKEIGLEYIFTSSKGNIGIGDIHKHISAAISSKL